MLAPYATLIAGGCRHADIMLHAVAGYMRMMLPPLMPFFCF